MGDRPPGRAHARVPRVKIKTTGSLAALAWVAACGGRSTSPGTTLVTDAVLAEVSADQRYIAYYKQPRGLANGPYSGSLEVMPLPSGAAISLGEGAFDANFSGSARALYFFQRPTFNAATSSYAGALSIWTPALTAPVSLSSGYVPVSSTTPDHSTTLYFDVPGLAAGTAGAAKLVRTAECAGTTCPVTTLAEGVVVLGTRMSGDGSYAAYDMQTTNGDGQYAVSLVSVANGTTTQVATIAGMPSQVNGFRLSDLSIDGSLLATLTQGSGGAPSIQVISTATGAPVPWAAPPPGTTCTKVLFSDASTLFVGALDAQGNPLVFRTTATEAAPFVQATQFFLTHGPSGAERYFFFSTTPGAVFGSGSPYDLQMIDLSGSPSPIPLAQSTRSAPALSGDLSMVWFVDQYDAATGLGALKTASLPSGQVSAVASPVYGGSANFGAGKDDLFYFENAAVPSPAVPNGLDEPLDVYTGGRSQRIDPDALRWATGENPPTLYVSAENPLRIYSEALP